MSKMKIGIRPVIDGRFGGIRESLEGRVLKMAENAANLISENLCYQDGTKVECVIGNIIGGGAEAAKCEEYFQTQNVCATLSVTPSWCYGSETLDMNPKTIKAVWGFNGTERPGAVYLAAVLSAHAQKGLPAFSIYGDAVQDADDTTIPTDVKEKILLFAKCAIAVGTMRNKSYVNLGSVSMGIMGSYCDDEFFQKYLGIRTEFVDLTEVLRRINLEIYDKEEYDKALAWTYKNCKEGVDINAGKVLHEVSVKSKFIPADKDWEFVVKLTLVCRDILIGNEKLNALGWKEEAMGKNAIAGGFQGQRAWTDWLPNGDFTEALLNSSFDWNGKRSPLIFATENDTLNAVSMLFGNLITDTAAVFADVRTYWSPESIKRVTGKDVVGKATAGVIHLINSGAAALDGTGVCKDETGKNLMKKWWNITDKDITNMLNATDWCRANLEYFRGGGFSSHFKTEAEMPVTLIRVNLVDGVGPSLQLAEGFTVTLDDEIHSTLDNRTDKTWPTTWFVPNLTGHGAFKSVYDVMANWGANHGAFVYGHVGKDLITLASMLRIPVTMHNSKDTFRPHSWSGFGTENTEMADFNACKFYGPLYK